ncbi:hypothetical protein F4803DRAFT_538882 [Xylaria telfairii]|nr:hypothetical protein F4803DRAFT_538882 [Xylaria telfairii]
MFNRYCTGLVRLWSTEVCVFSCLGLVMLASLSALSVSVPLRQILEWCEWLETTRSTRHHLLDDPIPQPSVCESDHTDCQ